MEREAAPTSSASASRPVFLYIIISYSPSVVFFCPKLKIYAEKFGSLK